MFSHDLNFSPNLFGNEIGMINGLDRPRSRTSAAKAHLSDIRTRHGAPETVSTAEFLTEELVVRTLRSTESPETIYWLLRYFVEVQGQNRVINTDKGKTIYIELDRLEDVVTVYVGGSDSLTSLHDESRPLFAMEVVEKYDFAWYASLGIALKRKYSAQAIQDQAYRENNTVQPSTPTLFYTAGNESVCVLRTNWYQCVSKLPLPDANEACATKSYGEYTEALAADEAAARLISAFKARHDLKQDK